MNCGDKYEKEKNRITTTGTATTADAENIRPVRAETTAQVHKENVDKLASYITTTIKCASTHYLSLYRPSCLCKANVFNEILENQLDWRSCLPCLEQWQPAQLLRLQVNTLFVHVQRCSLFVCPCCDFQLFQYPMADCKRARRMVELLAAIAANNIKTILRNALS